MPNTTAAAELPTSYDIEANKLPEAEAIIARANTRAAKAGIHDALTYTVRHYTKPLLRANGTPVPGVTVPMVEITLNRAAVAYDGWEFVGTITWDPEAGPIARIVPGKELGERPEAQRCDVCASSRDRKRTYVVRHVDGEVRYVGSSCLVPFLGVRPAGLWLLEFDIDIKAPAGYGGTLEELRYDVLRVLTFTSVVVARHGWVPRSRAYGTENPPTADLVWDLLRADVTGTNKQPLLDLLADAADPMHVQAAEELRATAIAMEGDSDYEMNLRALAQAETVTPSNLGMLVSVAAVAARNRVREEAQNREGNSVFVGAKGEKLTPRTVEVLRTTRTEGDYGSKTVVRMLDEDGNVFTWFATGVKEFASGELYLMTGTVKKHETYRDVAQTIVTRAKLTPVS